MPMMPDTSSAIGGVAPWKAGRFIVPQNIGFISTRFAGTDGVSLESAKWAEVLEADRHTCFWYAGRLDRPPAHSHCVPEANFGHPENDWINAQLWGQTARSSLVSRRVRELAEYLKHTLYEFVRRYEIRVLIIENALSIPMHVPLGIALTELLIETHIPAIAHHHDFFWERTRFSINAASDYLDMAFPPRERDLQHVVINQAAQEELSWRKGVPSILVPNVLNFAQPPPVPDAYSENVRAEIGLAPDDIFILQPTRVVPRKGIEHAISLVRQLNDPRCKLVVSHEAGDEGLEYRTMLAEWARQSNVDLRFIETRISDTRQYDSEGRKVFTLWDLYPHADLVSYPSLYEGFGNAFLEAVYFRVPLLMNRYAIFGRDIEPKGFRTIVMDGFLTSAVVDEVRRVLGDPAFRKNMVDHNFELASRHYDYTELRRHLRGLLSSIPGITSPTHV